MDYPEQTSMSQIVVLFCSILVTFASTIFFVTRNAILSRLGAAVALSCLQHSFYTSLLTSSLPPAQITGISLFAWGLYANATEQILLSRYDADDVLTVKEKRSGRHLSTIAHFLRAVDVIFRFSSALGNWVIGYVSVRLAHSFVAAVSVLLGFSEPEDWPHLNGPISSWSTVRTFWGTFWHRLFRKALAGWGDFIPDKVLQLRRGTLLSRYSRLTLAFFVSGLMHRCVHYFYRLEFGERIPTLIFILCQSGYVILGEPSALPNNLWLLNVLIGDISD
ncbi:TRI7-trichothecene biosynthesis [Fusarium mundagurra]|uniref:TRI7-trichothecene biosynthesis n=1 Tax=Fusarium mundagurra TaxID=1567541 RepID=A0A8H5YMP4_9HYPO|nr:TRI7-trichothecene biosynthesis [Fusarium mundagurra]